MTGTAREAARELLVSSLTGRAAQMREHERKCRAAYTKGPLHGAATRLADVYQRAAEVFENELALFEREELGGSVAQAFVDRARPSVVTGGSAGPGASVFEPGDGRLALSGDPCPGCGVASMRGGKHLANCPLALSGNG